MSKTKIKLITGTEGDEIDLPVAFDTPFRPDLIKRAVLSEQSKQRQPQGRYKLAGKLTAATATRPGRGISLVPRTHGSGTHHGNRAAIIPSTRGGRLAHPPRVEKNYVENINKKEYALALKAAVNATTNADAISERGHRFDEGTEFPIVVEDRLNEVLKTSEMIEVLENLGLGPDIERTKHGRSIKSGKGKMRGRKYRQKKGPLLVFAEECDGYRAGSNIPGVDVSTVDELSVEILAPGARGGRVTVWTEGALEIVEGWK